MASVSRPRRHFKKLQNTFAAGLRSAAAGAVNKTIEELQIGGALQRH